MNVYRPDEKSKLLFIQQFPTLSAAFFDSDQISQFTPWDLSVLTNSGERLAFELKNRKIESTRYDDNFIEEIKVIKIRPMLKKCFDRCLVVSMYIDGKMKMTNIERDYERQKKLCPETTEFGRKKYILKDCAIFKTYKIKDIKNEKNNSMSQMPV